MPTPRFQLSDAVVEQLSTRLHDVAVNTVAAIRKAVPEYSRDFGGPMGETIQNAVEVALSTFLRLAQQAQIEESNPPFTAALEGAYALGRGEARSGRTVEALLAAYRTGARVSWRELAEPAVAAGVPAETMVAFAELVFAYIDELSAASVAGHTEELAVTGRVRERHLERLVHALLTGASTQQLDDRADTAEWKPPKTLTAVLLPEGQDRATLSGLAEGTLRLGEPLDELRGDVALTVLLVPDLTQSSRRRLVSAVAGRGTVVGPTRAWREARVSYLRALRAKHLATGGEPVIDTEEHLVELVLTADEHAWADLRARALAPFAELKPVAREKLTETLRSWLVHQGRRDDVAAHLFVHPQTVRYRMGQVRDLFGDRLDDPEVVAELLVALAINPTAS